MATAFKMVEEMGVGRLGLSLPPLTATESIALEALRQIALEERVATKAEICAAIGSSNYDGGTASGVINRLERKGYIETHRFQRGLQVCIPMLGICTRPPACTVPHWRTIVDRVPTPAIHRVRESDQSTAAWIESTARSLGRDLADFLAELVKRGVRDFQADQAEGEIA